MRSFFMVVGLTAAIALSAGSLANAASAGTKSSSASNNYSRAAAQSASSDVPANCVRQECGKLWCWQMRGKSAGGN